MEDGPSEHDVTDIGQHIRRLLELDQPSIAERYRDATYVSTRSRLDVLCGKLFKYAEFVTQVVFKYSTDDINPSQVSEHSYRGDGRNHRVDN